MMEILKFLNSRLFTKVTHLADIASYPKKNYRAVKRETFCDLFYMPGLRTYCFIASGCTIKRLRAISSIGSRKMRPSDANRILINRAGFLFRCTSGFYDITSLQISGIPM